MSANAERCRSFFHTTRSTQPRGKNADGHHQRLRYYYYTPWVRFISSILNDSTMTVYWLLPYKSHTTQPPAHRLPTRECYPSRHGVSASERLVLGILRVSCQPCERRSFSRWWRWMDPLLCAPRWKPCATPYSMMQSSTSLTNLWPDHLNDQAASEFEVVWCQCV